MSGPEASIAIPVLSTKRSTSPRPPAVGEEVKKFHDTSQPYPENCKNWNMEYQIKPSEYVRSVTPSCTDGVTESSDCIENSPNASMPPPYKWAQSLLCLLEDIQGVSLFQQFLKQEGQDNRCLSFWFACRGVKKHDPNDWEGLVKLINVVFDKKVKRISAISGETKEDIKQRLLTSDIDDTIFDAAQHEVEAYMMKTTYPNFLNSDLYIQHLGGWQNELPSEKESRVSAEPVNLLPTVHEDSELQIMTKPIPLTKGNLLNRNKISPVIKLKSEGPAGYLRSPYNNSYSSYHCKYGSYLPASAQDSELQSLSSDAQTDDTMSLTDSSVGDFPMHTRSKQRRQQKLSKHNAIINKDKLSHGTFIPRTERLPESMQPKTPEEFHAILVRKLNKVLEDQRMKEKISEKLKSLDNAENSKPDVVIRNTCKPNPAPVFDSGFLCEPAEENVQDILDQHISRVFGQQDSGQHTPAMSSGCLSPPGARPSTDLRVPPRGVSCEPPPDIALEAQKYQMTVPNSIKHRRDHDTHSTDSAMFDYVSDDNLPSSYRSQYSSSVANSELVDYSRRSREHSKRYISKKLSSMTDSSSSCVDSGISLACESVPSYSKVTCWLETKRISDQEREHIWRNSSTSPVLSRSSSSRKAIVYNSSRGGGQEVGCSQWSAISTQIIAQDPCMPCFPPPDTTSNLIEARRRLEDESRAKLKLKNVASGRNSHDVTRMKFSKGYDSFEDGMCHRKMSRKSCPGTGFEPTPISSNTCSDVTVIGYSYGRHSVPYLSKLPGKNITLRQFKSLLSKKGNFRYFFKTASDDFGTGVVFEEVTDDIKVLPMWEGKVFCVIESMDDNTVM